MSTNESCATDKTTWRCAWPWLSGFFAAPAFVHLVRILSGWSVRIGSTDIAMSVSWICFGACGVLAVLCAVLGCRNRAL